MIRRQLLYVRSTSSSGHSAAPMHRQAQMTPASWSRLASLSWLAGRANRRRGFEVDRCDGRVGYTLYFRRIWRVVFTNVEKGEQSVCCGGKVARLHSSEEMRALVGRARRGEFRMAIDGRSIDKVDEIEFLEFVYRGDGYGYW